MKRIIILIFTLLLVIGCTSDDEDSTEVSIRIANASAFDFQNIVVADTSFENTASGQNSTYKVFDAAYRYAFIELKIEGNTYTIQPIDFVGETLLETGTYTYKIDANDSQERYGKLRLTLVED